MSLPRYQIYELMRTRAAQGVAILWVSTDFDELATVSHRILLCAHGRIAGTMVPRRSAATGLPVRSIQPPRVAQPER